MFELRKEDINLTREQKFRTSIMVVLEDPNPMLLKAKAEFIADAIDGIIKVAEAHEARYEFVYGDEVIRHAHYDANNFDDITAQPHIKVDSREIQKNLLERAFDK